MPNTSPTIAATMNDSRIDQAVSCVSTETVVHRFRRRGNDMVGYGADGSEVIRVPIREPLATGSERPTDTVIAAVVGGPGTDAANPVTIMVFAALNLRGPCVAANSRYVADSAARAHKAAFE